MIIDQSYFLSFKFVKQACAEMIYDVPHYL